MSLFTLDIDLYEVFGKAARIDYSDFICLLDDSFSDPEGNTIVVITPKHLYETCGRYCDQSSFTHFVGGEEELQKLGLYELTESAFESFDSLRELVNKLHALGIILSDQLKPLVVMTEHLEEFAEKIEEVKETSEEEPSPAEGSKEEEEKTFIKRWNIVISYNGDPFFTSLFESLKDPRTDPFPARNCLNWVLYRRSKGLNVNTKEELVSFSEESELIPTQLEEGTNAVVKWDCEFRKGDVLTFTFFPLEIVPPLTIPAHKFVEKTETTCKYRMTDRGDDGLDFYFEGFKRISLLPDNIVFIKSGRMFLNETAPVPIDRTVFQELMLLPHDQAKSHFAVGTESDHYLLNLRFEYFGEIDPICEEG